MAKEEGSSVTRRGFVKTGLNALAGLSLVGGSGLLINRSSSEELVWQLDPNLCVQCEKCSTECVLAESAVKVVHSTSMCGYCDLCSGYLEPGAKSRDTGAESQLCPTGAIKRTYVEDPYFEYQIDEKLCIGCGKCVKGCGAFGNGSMYLQVRHDRCTNCNECSIARICPAQAYSRVPASRSYLLRGDEAQKFSGI
ncbi:MAG: twin-arginine translocation signal domain-containing protein [Gemmatimonadetes bacterium]|jgi:Na+-translocating ferredoxin:NAD+ oxidoreductase subunit B|nr:twin-arginine translocation signal domain-containing protein [Gemmatimonadota bacterium]